MSDGVVGGSLADRESAPSTAIHALRKERPKYDDVVVWDRLAESADATSGKGQQVAIEVVSRPAVGQRQGFCASVNHLPRPPDAVTRIASGPGTYEPSWPEIDYQRWDITGVALHPDRSQAPIAHLKHGDERCATTAEDPVFVLAIFVQRHA